MAREIERLTVAQAARLDEPGMHPDGRGLYLQILETAAGALARSWIFRFKSPVTGRTRDMGLGSARDFTLLMARGRAEAARRLLADGRDPITQREIDRRAAQKAAGEQPTFERVARDWYEANKLAFSNEKYRTQWLTTMERYAFPKIGKLLVSEVDTDKVLSVLRPIWHTKSRTAKRICQRIEKTLASATVQGHREGPNPARWKGHLDHLLPSVSKIAPVANHPALPYREIPQFMAHLRATEGVAARALEFTVLTVARSGSVIEARWSEIDHKQGKALWVSPAEHQKDREELRVPLCARAAKILRELPRESEYVFMGAWKGRPIGNAAMWNVLSLLNAGPATVHGFRSSFRDWSGEETDFASDICEAAMAHAIGDATRRAYQRGDLLRKRRLLMDAWSAYCNQPPRNANVRPLAPRLAVAG